MSINGITDLEVNDITAKVDPGSGKITRHRIEAIRVLIDEMLRVHYC